MDAAEPREPGRANRDYYDRPEVRASYARTEGLTPSESVLVEAYVPPGSRVLDVGCGAGRVSLALQRSGRVATGLDVSPGMIATARATAERLALPVEFVEGDATALPFDESSFDATIFACNGIGHLDADGKRRSLAELVRVTRPGGHVVLSFRSPYALNRLLPPLLVRAVRAPRTRDEVWEGDVYVHRPSFRTMRRLVREAGLEIVCETSQLALAREVGLGPLLPFVGGQFFVVGRVPG